MPPRLTTLALQAVTAQLRPGDLAIDATVGNGHDTLAMANAVSPGGRVAGFDIQQVAIDRAAARVKDAGLDETVHLFTCGHEDMVTQLPDTWRGRVRAVMFNLGYLPGSDRQLVTEAASTRAALEGALTMLAVDGLISVLLYRGHAGAEAETHAVVAWLAEHSTDLLIDKEDSPGPVWYGLRPRRNACDS